MAPPAPRAPVRSAATSAPKLVPALGAKRAIEVGPLGVAEVAAFQLPSGGQLVVSSGSVVDFCGDAIVNASNKQCVGGGGVDAAVSLRCGKALKAARLALPLVGPASMGVRCRAGDAVITIGGDLRAKWCIHAVGPDFRSEKKAGGGLLSAAQCEALVTNA